MSEGDQICSLMYNPLDHEGMGGVVGIIPFLQIGGHEFKSRPGLLILVEMYEISIFMFVDNATST